MTRIMSIADIEKMKMNGNGMEMGTLNGNGDALKEM